MKLENIWNENSWGDIEIKEEYKGLEECLSFCMDRAGDNGGVSLYDFKDDSLRSIIKGGIAECEEELEMGIEDGDFDKEEINEYRENIKKLEKYLADYK